MPAGVKSLSSVMNKIDMAELLELSVLIETISHLLALARIKQMELLEIFSCQFTLNQ